MSIDVSSAPKGVKALTSADPHAKKSGKAGAVSGEGGSGFSAVMNVLSAAEDGTAGLMADASVAAAMTGLLVPAVVTPAQTANTAQGLTVVPGLNGNANDVSQKLGGAVPLSAEGSASSFFQEGKEPPVLLVDPIALSGKAGQQAKVADAAALLKSPLASVASDVASVGNAAAQVATDLTRASPVSTLLAHKSAAQAQTLSVIQQDLKEARASALSPAVVPSTDAATASMAGSFSDLVRSQGRFGARPGMGQSGSSGFDGAFSQAMAATHRADAVFEVPATSATVPDTAVAETVSYWASQGIQTAELKLDGFGDEPIEVSIVLNGDQAQIDFRTDQMGVRQVIENAAAQLKDLLSSQGLQLAGVSVGSSGGGGQAGDERRQRTDAQPLTLVKTETVGAATTRTANPAVGRSLDLFV
jgi:flagellar hook-length control protein FliK